MENKTTNFCSQVSTEANEPMLGTALPTETWILIEYTAGWSPKPFENNNLPPAVQNYLKNAVDALTFCRPLMIKQPGRNSDTLKMFVVHSSPENPKIFSFDLTSYDEICAIGFEALLKTEPQNSLKDLYLVCAHGKRDKCCAKFGLPVYDALKNIVGDNVWQVSHVGGHRFAAVCIYLPYGFYYGKLTPAGGKTLINHHNEGKIWIEKFRGRSCISHPVQVAEVYFRQNHPVAGLDALQLDLIEEIEAFHWKVTLTDRQNDFTVCYELRRNPFSVPIPISCDMNPQTFRHFELLDSSVL